jgi:hypothetical protein
VQLYLRAHLSKSYYVPGEMAYAIVEASNGSRSKVFIIHLSMQYKGHLLRIMHTRSLVYT